MSCDCQRTQRDQTRMNVHVIIRPDSALHALFLALMHTGINFPTSGAARRFSPAGLGGNFEAVETWITRQANKLAAPAACGRWWSNNGPIIIALHTRTDHYFDHQRPVAAGGPVMA